jgi:hypothetical protein
MNSTESTLINKASSEEINVMELSKKLDRIEELLNNEILNNCNKMSNHIDFIERIYDYIKFPLFYITDKVRYITSRSKVNIPIEHSSHETETTYEG